PTEGRHIVLHLAFSMAVVVASFGLQTVTERITKAKHIQFVSGVYVLTYWLSALLWDLIYYFISCCLLLGVFKYCELGAFVEDYNFLDTMLIFMLYGWATVPLMYLGSYLFSSSTAAYIKLTLFNYFSTVFSIIVDTIMHLLGKDFPHFPFSPGNISLHEVVELYQKSFQTHSLTLGVGLTQKETECVDQAHSFAVFSKKWYYACYNFAMSVSKFFDDYEVKRLCTQEIQNVYVDCRKKCVGTKGSPPATDEKLRVISRKLKAKCESPRASLVAFPAMKGQRKLSTQIKAKEPMHVISEYVDENVENERKKVLAQSPKLKNNPLLLKDLVKTYYKYPAVKAVRNVSLVVKKSECFGLFGLNGAGKTTVLKMLTGDETISSGVVLIDGISLIENIRKVRSRIGYCPQSNPLLNHLTGWELLIMYARLQGVPEPNICKYVEIFLLSMHLENHADKFVYTYSKENKRKLSIVVALMGKSSVVFLDEPASGMDSIARRLLWDTVTWMCKAGKTVIVTSHR
ncbi:PREDICTED: ATP-binding cassette sub-family A member 3-like, partial [Myotis davidii]|uniref:ATP-binding cassette sub-family A member 3-like n=1 Tax=Myotis davidii TaxID=225400 RepID=UPI000767BAFF